MSLYQQWREMAEAERSQEAVEQFWNDYFKAETENYKKLLNEHDKLFSGKVSELAGQFNMDEPTFAGFIDGINTSLKKAIDLDTLESDTDIALDIDFEKLYYNMVGCKADWLYELPQWNDLLDEDTRKQLYKKQKLSGTIVKGKKIGRNDPCPCGSGKKYKNCCGRNA